MIKRLALRGAKVYFTTRSEAKGKKTLEILQAQSPEIDQKNLEWLQLDVADVKSITATADELKRKETKLDLLSMLYICVFLYICRVFFLTHIPN